jgi:LemA protein
MGVVIFLAVLVLLACYGISLYRNLVALRLDVSQAWSAIDALVLQRHDELPRLIGVCAGHMTHEGETLERLTRARAAVLQATGRNDVAAVSAAESLLRSSLGQLFVAVRNYPKLQADESFRHFQDRVMQLQQHIADRCELYNGTVNLINVRMGRFPNSCVSRMVDFSCAAPFEFTDEREGDADMKTPLD